MSDAHSLILAEVERELAEMAAVGLRGRGDVGLSRAVDQLESAIREIRALVA